MVRITGLWKQPSEKGTYLSGNLGSAKLFVLKNKFKSKDSDPDYVVYVKQNTNNSPHEDEAEDI